MNSTPPKSPRIRVTSSRPLLRPAFHWASTIALAVLLAGCSGDDSVNPSDDGGIDASGSDSTPGDATGPGNDAGFDGTASDAGSDAGFDGSVSDGGSDAAHPDAGKPDAGSDAGHPDAGNPDAGSDAGEGDAGPDAEGLDASNLDAATSDAGSDATDLDAGPDASGLDAADSGAEDASSDAGAEAGEDAGEDAGADATIPATYTLNAQPIFQDKCAPCHTTAGSGGVNFASVYADTQKAANAGIVGCTGLNVGACTIVRIKNGSMPRAAGCTGNPTTDVGNAKCLTQAEEDTIQAWVNDGELP
jgi:hypothetical protein